MRQWNLAKINLYICNPTGSIVLHMLQTMDVFSVFSDIKCYIQWNQFCCTHKPLRHTAAWRHSMMKQRFSLLIHLKRSSKHCHYKRVTKLPINENKVHFQQRICLILHLWQHFVTNEPMLISRVMYPKYVQLIILKPG